MAAALLNRQSAEMVVAGLVITGPGIAVAEARQHEAAKEENLVVWWKVPGPANKRRAAAASAVKASIAFGMRHHVVFGCKATRACATPIRILHVNRRVAPSTDHVQMEKDTTAVRTGSASAVCVPVVRKECQR